MVQFRLLLKNEIDRKRFDLKEHRIKSYGMVTFLCDEAFLVALVAPLHLAWQAVLVILYQNWMHLKNFVT